MEERRPQVKEIFMADVQQNSRPCARLHCAYIIEPVSGTHIVPADTVIDSVTDKLAISRGMSIHKFSDEKIVVSFPYHKKHYEP